MQDFVQKTKLCYVRCVSPEDTLIRAHLRAPRNVGRLAEPCWRGRGENAACGDVLELSLSVAGSRIGRALFQARGCSGVIASASLATEALIGRSLREALELDWSVLIDAAGGLAPRRAHAAQVVQRAVREAVGGALAAADGPAETP